MKRKIKSIVVLFFLLFFWLSFQSPVTLFAQDDSCEPFPPDNDQPAGDHGDDNFSYSSGISKIYNLAPEALILTQGFYEDALRLFGGLRFSSGHPAQKLLEVKPFLVIPSGGFYGIENDSTLKHILKEYVRQGGTLVVFAQQYGTHFDNVVPVPEGERLKSFGWREDQSCYNSSAYHDIMHPVLASWVTWGNLGTMQTDGYFVEYPANSVVLLRRTKNRYPLLLSYPYGQGTVIVSSLFTDWAAAHGQASYTEINLVRDLTTYALNAGKAIPVYDLKVTPNPSVNLRVNIKNKSEETASLVKYTAYTPNRKKILKQGQMNVSVEPGNETIIDLSFGLAGVINMDYGICHVDYELYDGDGELVQMAAESDGGRFAIFLGDTTYTHQKPFNVWITSTDEQYYFTEKADITLHVKNYREEPVTIDWYYEWGHQEDNRLPSLTVGGGEEKELHILGTFPQYIADFKELRAFFNLRYKTSTETYYYRASQKGFLVKGIPTLSSIQLNTPNPVDPGGTLDYTIRSKFNGIPIAGPTAMIVSLEKYDRASSTYNPVNIIYEGTHDFSSSNSFEYKGSYTPNPLHPSGNYHLKLEVTTANGIKEDPRVQYFTYERSGFRVAVEKTLQNGGYVYRLMPGQSYSIPVKLKNSTGTNNYAVKNGRYAIQLTAPSGSLVFQKEGNNIALNPGEEKNLEETFTFNPVEIGNYTLSYAYTDETIGDTLNFAEIQKLLYQTDVAVKADKEVYRYQDIANVGITINGIGNYHLKFSCPAVGVMEERDLQIPAGQYSITDVFEVPIGVQSYYNIDVEVQDISGIKQQNEIILANTPLGFDYTGNFAGPYAVAGTDLELALHIKEITGNTRPLSGELIVVCNELNYNNTETITLQPLVDNRFNIQIPLGADTLLGTYRFDVQLKIADGAVINKHHSITLLGAALEFYSPGAGEYNPGDTLTIGSKNIGGKNGQFDIEIFLKDNMNKEVVQRRETHAVSAGATELLTLEIPGHLKEGRYQIVLAATETITGKKTVSSFPLSLTGTGGTLNAYPLKPGYTIQEIVSGKAELTANGAIENGSLNARIIHYTYSDSGIEEETPGDLMKVNLIERAVSAGNHLYMVTDKGVIDYERVSKNFKIIYSFETNRGFNCADMLVSSSGEIWAGAYAQDGVYHWDSSGQMTQFLPDTHISNYYIRDMLEVSGVNGPEIWVGGATGISVYRNGEWSAYDENHGLPFGYIYKLAIDGNGTVWVSTESGLYTFNGTGFVAVSSSPMGTTSVIGRLTSDADGNIWAATTTSVYCFHPDTSGEGEWQQWSYTGILPQYTLFIDQLDSINGQLWIRGRARDTNNVFTQLLINYTDHFTVFSEAEIPALRGLDFEPLISGNSEGEQSALFTCTAGYLEYDETGSWNLRMLSVDEHKLSGPVYCLTKDSAGNLWAGTEYGLAMYDGNRWHNYYLSVDNVLLPPVSIIDIDAQDNIYGYSPDRNVKKILKLNRVTGFVELISMPTGFSPFYKDRMAVDLSGRIWMGWRDLYYYENNQWQKLVYYTNSFPGYIHAMAKSGDGGVWVAAWETYPAEINRLVFIKNGTIVNNFTYKNSGALNQGKDRLYVDDEGKLWIRYVGGIYWAKDREFQSFDGENWLEYSTYPGYPQNGYPSGDKGFRNFVKGPDGQMVLLGYDNVLYRMENQQFVPILNDKLLYNNSMVYYKGVLHIAGSENYISNNSSSSLFKIKFGTGFREEELWSQTYAVNLTAGESVDIDLLPGQTFPEGAYILKTSLLNAPGQELDEVSTGFVVNGEGLSLTLSGPIIISPYIKKDTPTSATIEIQNNTATDYTDLKYIVQKQSSTGTVEILKDMVLNIPAGGNYTDSITFTVSETGMYNLIALVGKDNSSGDSSGGDTGGDTGSGDTGDSGVVEGVIVEDARGETVRGLENTALNADANLTILAQMETVLEVTEPAVEMKVTAPSYAGNDAVTINITLTNNSKFSTELSLEVLSTGATRLLDEDLTLKPGEERILFFTDTITADKNYTVSLSGDATGSETLTVQYGYKENFSLDIESVYREGALAIGYTLSNSGGITFIDTVYAELYSGSAATPLYVFERRYTLYPLLDGDTRVTDTLNLDLAPGNYQLKYHTSQNPRVQTSDFTVLANGKGTIVLRGMEPGNPSLFPKGFNSFTYTLCNNDTVAGVIGYSVTITPMATPQTPILSETRSFFLQPGQTQADVIYFDIEATGNYILAFSGAKLNTAVSASFQVANFEEIESNITIGAVEKDDIRVNVSVNNTGYYPFNGTVSLEVQPDNLCLEEAFTVEGGSAVSRTTTFKTEELSPGEKTVKTIIYDSFRNVVSESSKELTLLGPDIELINPPTNLTVDAGGFTPVPLTLVNLGHQPGSVVLRLNAFDSLYREQEIFLGAGEEIQLSGIEIDAPDDLPSGYYPLYYTLSNPYIPGNSQTGHINFKVNSLEMNVHASLDRTLYNEGETAQLTLEITGDTASDTRLEAVVNWGNFNERRSFSIASGSTSLTFAIPLAEKLESKVSYGIYFEEGKGIYLNDIYLNFRGEVTVELDKQVYSPGDTVEALFTVQQAGEITAEAFGKTYTIPVSSSSTLSFTVPQDNLGGTYGLYWEFTPVDRASAPLSGNHSFDVAGLVVKMAKAGLEKGKYARDETINANFIFQSNRDETLELRCWVSAPSDEWEYLGATQVTLSAQEQTGANFSHTFTTSEAGTHQWIYGLYKVTDEDAMTVLAGHISFDVGDAVLVGFTTDQFEYKNGTEAVQVKSDYFGEGTAQLDLYLDGEIIENRSLNINGIGSEVISLDSSRVSGGVHSLKAILTKDGLTSSRTTGFIYGVNLPDLSTHLVEIQNEHLAYSFKLKTVNAGKILSPAASLEFSDNGSVVETISIPSLQAGGTYEYTFNWNGSGKAGSHELKFFIDSTDSVKEYNEKNNTLVLTEEVPLVFYKLEAEPVIGPAHTPISIITRLTNNQGMNALVDLNMTITNDNSGEVIFQRSKTEELSVFGSQVLNDIFDTGVYPAGNYTLSQVLTGSNINITADIMVVIEATRALNGTLAIQPGTFLPGVDTDVTMTLKLQNSGNVVLEVEDDTLELEIFHNESQEVVKTVAVLLSTPLPIAGETIETENLILNLLEGTYEVRLKYLDKVISTGELTVGGGIKSEKIIAVYPRVLLLDMCANIDFKLPSQDNNHGNEKNKEENNGHHRIFPSQYIAALLQSQAIRYEMAEGLVGVMVKLHKGYHNVVILTGNVNMMGKHLRNELQERVWMGESLVLVCDKPFSSPYWADFLGVNVKPLPGKMQEQTVQLKATPLNNGGEIVLVEKSKWYLNVVAGDVQVLGETKRSKQPVIAYRKYGRGHILVLAIPVNGNLEPGSSALAQLLLNAVAQFSQDVYSGANITRILPVEVSLKNESSTERQVIVKELLPYGVEAFDYNPVPLPEESGTDDELKWQLKLAANSETKIGYWLKLPDRINSYEIKSEVYDGDQKLEDVSLTLDVSQTVLSQLDELIVELESLDTEELTGKDRQYIRKAIHDLQQVRNRFRESQDFWQMLNNLFDMISAGHHLGKVSHMAVSFQRLKAAYLMRYMSWRLYSKLKDIGARSLNPFLQMIYTE